jgi:hypothetical protein
MCVYSADHSNSLSPKGCDVVSGIGREIRPVLLAYPDFVLLNVFCFGPLRNRFNNILVTLSVH